MTSERAAEAGEGGTWRCPSCRDTVAPMGMCQKCGVFGLRYESRGLDPVNRTDWVEIANRWHRRAIAAESPCHCERPWSDHDVHYPVGATRGEPPEPGPAIDVERLARALKHADSTQGLNGYADWAERIAAEYDWLAVTEPADGPGETVP